MKKIITLLFVALVCLSITACGETERTKSPAVTTVESMITELPQLALESEDERAVAREKVDAAMAAYNALSVEEQNLVSNKSLLDSERVRLFESEYNSVALLIQYMNFQSEFLYSAHVIIWDNVGASDFFTYRDRVEYFGNSSYSEIYDSFGKKTAVAAVWCAGKAFDPDYFEHTFENFSSDKIADIEQKSQSYVQALDNLEKSLEYIDTLINNMKKTCPTECSEDMDALWTWWIESSLFAEHANEPSGNLNSYVSTATSYQENIERYQKLAGY